MIIELPVLPGQHRIAKRYKMGFFHFSNNNLAIRKACADELGGYDPHLPTAEDVDLCFRLALSPSWVACREPGVIIRHKARKTLRATLRQMWNWGINFARPYLRTGRTGIYLYWISPQLKTITRDLEIASFPILVNVFATPFHVLHALTALAVLLAVLRRHDPGTALCHTNACGAAPLPAGYPALRVAPLANPQAGGCAVSHQCHVHHCRVSWRSQKRSCHTSSVNFATAEQGRTLRPQTRAETDATPKFSISAIRNHTVRVSGAGKELTAGYALASPQSPGHESRAVPGLLPLCSNLPPCRTLDCTYWWV